MSPQLLWTIAGLILTVLTLGGVTISSYQSQDAAKIKLIATEVGNLATASKLWLANDAQVDGAYTGLTNETLVRYVPDLIDSITFAATSKVQVNENPAPVQYTVTGFTESVRIATTFPLLELDSPAYATKLESALSNKACAVSQNPVKPIIYYDCAR